VSDAALSLGSSVSIEKLLSDLRFLGDQAKRRAVEFGIYRMDYVPERIDQDPLQLRRALFGVVEGALQSTFEGEVSVTVDMTTGGKLSFTISSTDDAFADESSERMLARELVQRLGGEVEVLRDVDHSGAIIQITLATH
jgi:hypothetical protein